MRKGGFRAARRRQPRAPRPGKTLKVSPPRAQAQRAAGARPRRRVAASGAPGRVPFRDGFARPFQRSRPALRGGGSAAAAIARGGGLRDGMHRRRGEMRLRIAGLSFIALSAPVPEGKACGMKKALAERPAAHRAGGGRRRGGADLRGGGAQRRSHGGRHPAAAHPAQRAAADRDAMHDPLSPRPADRGRARLPRPRRAAADARPGAILEEGKDDIRFAPRCRSARDLPSS